MWQRISLLTAEEEKAFKNIIDARSRAIQMLENKLRSEQISKEIVE